MEKVLFTSSSGLTERLWATRINDQVVKLANIPFLTTEMTLGDLVEVNRRRQITRRIEACGRTRHGQYESGASREDMKQRWRLLVEHLEEYDINTENMNPGLFCMAVPRDIDDSELIELAASSPVPFELLD